MKSNARFVRNRARSIIILVFALLGGVIAGVSAPGTLQSVYETAFSVNRTMAPLAKSAIEEKLNEKDGSKKSSKIELQKTHDLQPENVGQFSYASHPAMVAAVIIFGMIIGGGFGVLVYRFFEKLGSGWDHMNDGDKVSLFTGIFAGIAASLPFLFILSALGNVIAPLLTFGLMMGFSSMAIYALRSMEDILPWYRKKGTGKRSGMKILDTNVIIDGRIYDVLRTRFIEGQLYVPTFVLEEVQHIADSSDALRRQRGRRGLEILRHLENDFNIVVGTHDHLAGNDTDEVDSRLVTLAKALGGDIITNDFNLNRVASLQKVTVLNLNDLALSLRPNVLPSEALKLLIVREGNQHNQGIGYLDDGTMVVVDGGKNHIGETVNLKVTQVIQTERGKLLFAEIDGDYPEEVVDPAGDHSRRKVPRR